MKRLLRSACAAACIAVFPGPALSAGEPSTGTMAGQVTAVDGTPMAGGQIFFFSEASGPPPSQEKYWRIPDFASPLDEAGRFLIGLPAGKYYVGAVKRLSGEKIGPPREGDLFFASSDETGKPRAYLLKAGEKRDLGVLAGAVPFKRPAAAYAGITAIEGTVRDADGKPVQGALVFAYLSPALVGKPLFASERSDKEGTYLLRVYEGGTYYLKVRDVYGGGPPVSGAVIGSFGQESPVAVSVKTREVVKGIHIKVIKFPGRGPKGAQQ